MLDCLKEYKDSLFREMCFLRDEGGRKYKINNGELLGKEFDKYAYLFELESELFLNDDAPIKLHAQERVVSGIVTSCDGFEIVLLLDDKIGENVPSAYFTVEPWQLLKALAEKMETISPLDAIAYEMITEGQFLAKNEGAEAIKKGQDTAIDSVFNNNISIIWGPPGTGKTTTMARIAIKAINDGKSILMLSHSNISVDGMIAKTADILNKENPGLLKSGRVLRYGYVRDEKLAQNSYAVAYNYVLTKNPSLKKELDNLQEKRNQYVGKASMKSDLLKVESKLKELRKNIRQYERQYVENSVVVGTTISKVTMDSLFEEKKYDVVMFDEVSMAYVPQILYAATLAKYHMVCVGDFRQLSPIAQSEKKDILCKDLFSYLGICDDDGVIHNHPWLTMLNTQYRMHSKIAGFSNKYLYQNQINNGDGVDENRASVVNKKPIQNPITLINTLGTYAVTDKNANNSRYNILNAIILFGLAITAKNESEEDVGIISSYNAQARLINAMKEDEFGKRNRSLACTTVHQFQGSERNVILFDPVENYPSHRMGFLMEKNENQSVDRLVNVAVTRARGKFITISNSNYWDKICKSKTHLYRKLIKYINEQGSVLSGKSDIGELISSISFGKKISHVPVDNAVKKAVSDIEKAQKSVIITLPPGKLIEGNEDILRALQTVRSRGIRILCKSQDYKSLPETWKSISFATENAVFPLILIDDDVLWYGLPLAYGALDIDKDGYSNLNVVFPMCFRMTGQRTIEIIKSFSKIEFKEIDGTISPLKEKNALNSTGTAESGFSEYISKKEFCPKCKSHMDLKKGRKIYMKCSNPKCDYHNYVDKNLLNFYLDTYNVLCPQHKCPLHGGLGQYGLYVRCEAGHFISPDEV